MKVTGGPDLIKDSLILHLDAGSYKSYPQSGNIWYDLSGNNHHAYGDPAAEGAGFSDTQFPVWQADNNGRFRFGGADGLTILTDMGQPANLTAEWWMYKDDVGTDYVFDGRNDGGTYWLWNYTSRNVNIGNVFYANDPVTYDATSNWWFKWNHTVITRSASTAELWINGEKIDDSRMLSSTVFDSGLGQYFRIGNRYTSSSRWIGWFSSIKFHSRVLTDTEILKNYNNTKHRFGL